MTDQKNPRAPRTPPTEERGFILTKKDGSEQLVMAMDVRVATSKDLLKALASKTEAVS
jgi:hypothetical protein